MILLSLFQSACAPLINDITTDPEHPVALYDENGLIDYPQRFAESQRRAYPWIVPLKVAVPPDVAYSNVISFVAREKSWREVRTRPSDRHLQAVAVTPLLRFKDDVAIEVRERDGGSEVHLRSRSRLGKGDLGTNARRIRDFLTEFEKSLTGGRK